MFFTLSPKISPSFVPTDKLQIDCLLKLFRSSTIPGNPNQNAGEREIMFSKDGFKIPENFSRAKIAEKYEVPKNLLQLVENEQNAFLALKIVEIIGEDEPYQLDAETIYFITDLLNRMNLIKLRNKVLISTLPLRT